MSTRAEWLSALAAFESAARHQNFAHAGEELHLTASAVSHHVRKLEARLGLPLFQRHARGVSLTPAGRQLADAASSSLADLEDVLRGLKAASGDHDLVRIATLHSFTCAWLMPRLPRFAALHPHVRLSIETGFALARFDDSGPDVAIRHGPGQWPGALATLLLHETLFPVAAASMRSFAETLTARDVARLPLVSDNARQGWPDWFRAARVRGITPDERFRFTDSTGAMDAAAIGLGAVLARECIVAPYLADGRLRRLPGPSINARWSYYVVEPTHRRLRPAARAFVDWVVAEARADAGRRDAESTPAAATPTR